ncbi:MAG: hypothetical protein ABWY25_04050 [Paenisporosarcina sp.]
MMLDEAVIEKVAVELSTKQMLGKLVIATTVGFAASKVAEKVFDVAVQAIRNRKAA